MRIIKLYIWEFIIGAILLIFVEDIRWFLFFLLIELITLIDFLRKLARSNQYHNFLYISAIKEKLGITDDEVDAVKRGIENSIPDKAFRELRKDIRDITTL